MAFDDGEFDTEMRCVALQVRDFVGQIIGALVFPARSGDCRWKNLQRRRLVRAAADRLSAEFGYTGEGEPRVKAAG